MRKREMTRSEYSIHERVSAPLLNSDNDDDTDDTIIHIM